MSVETIAPGSIVVDTSSDDAEPDRALVLDQYDEPAGAVTVDALDSCPTVAEVNVRATPETPVVEVVFLPALDHVFGSTWHDATPATIGRLCASRDDVEVTTYTYPVSRLATVDDPRADLLRHVSPTA